MWYVYLLECADTTFYCGITTDLKRRLAEHNGLRPGGAKYTQARRPVHLLIAVSVPNRATALRLEYQVKASPRNQKQTLLKSLL